MELLHNIVQEKGIMLLLVTHDPDIAETCDTIFEMDGGRIACAKMILKDLRLSPLRSILTSISMLVGIIAMIASVLVGTLGKEYLISVNAQVYGWTPTYAFVITESDFHDRDKMERFFQTFESIDDIAAITFSMKEDIKFAPMNTLTPTSLNNLYQNLMAVEVVCTTESYNQVYNLPMTSGRWLESSSKSGSRLEIVVNKKRKNILRSHPMLLEM